MKDAENTPFRIVEVDDEGWAAFKALEAQHRREYAASPEAVADHEAWVKAPPVSDSEWGSISPKESYPVIIPSQNQIPWAQRYDWASEKSKR